MGTENLPQKRDIRAVFADLKPGLILHRSQYEFSTEEAARQENVKRDLQRDLELREHRIAGR